MFRREHDIPTTEIDRYQTAADQVTDAGDFLEATRTDLSLDLTHAWRAPDLTLLQMGWAATALANDLTAEKLREAGARQHGDVTVVSPDIAYFALELSQNAARLMDGVRQVMPTQDTAEFDEETRSSLAAENMVPYWPRSPLEGRLEQWQDSGNPVATLDFMRGILRAARDIETYASDTVDKLGDPNKSLIAVPPEYGAMRDVIGDIMHTADVDLQAAEGLLLVNRKEDVSPQAAHGIYVNAHDGYIGMTNAFVGSVCPPSLGEEFLPRR